MRYIIAHDIGTTGVKSCIFDESLALKGYIYNRTDTWYFDDGSVLQSPEQWWQYIAESMRKLVAEAKVDPADVACVCIDGHMNGCIPVDGQNRLLMEKTPLWADFSAVSQARVIEKAIDAKTFYRITGCGMDVPIYPAAKILKTKEEQPDIYNKTDCFIGTKDYINMKLTGKRCTDCSDGTNYGLMDIKTQTWSEEILEAVGIDKNKLPKVLNSTDVVGGVTHEAAEACGLKQGTPVIEGAGDVISASVGAGSTGEDVYYINLGSATWLSKSYKADDFLSDESFRPFVLRHAVDGLLASQLVSFGGGICKQWMIDLLADSVSEDNGSAEKARDYLYRAVENREKDYTEQQNELIFLPYIRGGMPSAPGLRGSFNGLSMEHDALDMIDAVTAGVAYHLRAMMPFITNDGVAPDTLRIIGGGARSGRWCQMIADICGVKILCAPELQSATARGTAVIGGVGCGLFKNFSAAEHTSAKWETYCPDASKAVYYEKGYQKFQKLITALSN